MLWLRPTQLCALQPLPGPRNAFCMCAACHILHFTCAVHACYILHVRCSTPFLAPGTHSRCGLFNTFCIQHVLFTHSTFHTCAAQPLPGPRNTFYMNSAIQVHRCLTSLMGALLRGAVLWFGARALFLDTATLGSLYALLRYVSWMQGGIKQASDAYVRLMAGAGGSPRRGW